jgi:hypothetical protein
MDVTRRRLAPLALCAIALQLVLSLPVSAGPVLCVGSNGHVAVESGGCGNESPATSGDCEEFGESTPCTDTPLAASELRSAAGSRGGTLDATAPVAVCFAPAFAAIRARACGASVALAEPPGPPRTRVLRL